MSGGRPFSAGFTAQRSARSAAISYMSRDRNGHLKTRESLYFGARARNDGRYIPTLVIRIEGEGGVSRQPPSIEVVRIRQLIEQQCLQLPATDGARK